MARKQRWTDEWVAGLEHPAAGKPEVVFYDSTLSGHRLVIKRTRKVFEVQAKRPKQFGPAKTYVTQVGAVPPTTVEEARARAAEVLALIRAGKSPRPESVAGAPAATTRDVTLGQAWSDFKNRDDLRASTIRVYRGHWVRCLAKWSDVTLRTLVDQPRLALDEYNALIKARGPSEARHAMRLLRAIYMHASRLDVSLPRDRHPVSAIKMGKEPTRQGAAIPAAKMPAWKAQLEAIRVKSPLRASFAMLCLRLGTRPGELAKATWDEVDLERRVLTIPVSKTMLVEVPLTDQCIAEFEALKDLRVLNCRGRDFVFPANSKEGYIKQWLERKTVLSHSSNSGRHSHHTLGTRLGIKEIVLDVLEGRSLEKAGASAGRGYVDTIELGPEVRAAQELINQEIDRLFASSPK